MIALALLLQAAASAELPRPPQDWAGLPELQIARRHAIPAEVSLFVREEVLSGRCGAAERSGAGWRVHVPLAVLVSERAQVKRIVPRAIGCAAVEQYASGIVSRNARGNVAAHGAVDAWYRTSIDFVWTG